MGQLDLTAVMDGLAELFTTAYPGVNAYAWPVDNGTVPCLLVDWPSAIAYDMTFARGGDELSVPVLYVVGKTSGKDARDAISAVLAGVPSIKNAVDGNHDFGAARIASATITEISWGAVTYVGVKFDVEVMT